MNNQGNLKPKQMRKILIRVKRIRKYSIGKNKEQFLTTSQIQRNHFI